MPQAAPGELLEKQVFEQMEKYQKRERKLPVASTDKTPALSAYLEALRARLKQLSAAELQPGAPSMTITVSILQDGRVKGIELDQGSGDAKRDRKVLTSLKQLGPLPPLPAATREAADVLEVTARLPIE